MPILHETALWPLVEARAVATPDALLVVDERDRTLTFAEYRDACERVAAGLAAEGVGEGTPVSWQLPTWIESFVLVGALRSSSARSRTRSCPSAGGARSGFMTRRRARASSSSPVSGAVSTTRRWRAP